VDEHKPLGVDHQNVYVDTIPPHILAESEQKYEDILNTLSHVVELARRLGSDKPAHDVGARVHYALRRQWGPATVYAVLSAAAIELQRAGWTRHGVPVGGSPLASDGPETPDPGVDNPDRQEGSGDASEC
jgi:hypothetical protein